MKKLTGVVMALLLTAFLITPAAAVQTGESGNTKTVKSQGKSDKKRVAKRNKMSKREQAEQSQMRKQTILKEQAEDKARK